MILVRGIKLENRSALQQVDTRYTSAQQGLYVFDPSSKAQMSRDFIKDKSTDMIECSSMSDGDGGEWHSQPHTYCLQEQMSSIPTSVKKSNRNNLSFEFVVCFSSGIPYPPHQMWRCVDVKLLRGSGITLISSYGGANSPGTAECVWSTKDKYMRERDTERDTEREREREQE